MLIEQLMLYAILHALHSFGDLLFQSPGTIPLNGLCFDLFGLVLSHKSVLIFYPHSHVHCSLSYVYELEGFEPWCTQVH